MRKPIPMLSIFVKNFFKEKTGPVSLQEIYDYIKNNESIKIPPERMEITYGMPNWQHSIRRIISGLLKQYMIMKVGRSSYVWNKKQFNSLLMLKR